MMYALCLEEYASELHCIDNRIENHPRVKRSGPVHLEGIKWDINERTETFLLIFSIMINVLLVLLIANTVRK